MVTPRRSFQFNGGCIDAGIEFKAKIGRATIETHVACPIQNPKNSAG
jgi:hypothetical protein